MKKILILIILLMAPAVQAATITGEVFDFSLNRVDNIKVEINSTPSQRQITTEGSYSFEVPKGTYIIIAEQLQQGQVIATVNETIEVADAGTFSLDLLLFPLIEDIEVEQIEVSEEEVIVGTTATSNALMIASLLALFFIIALGYVFYQKKEIKAAESEEVTDIYSFIKKQGGRVTQKEIRKAFPQSEAKISLILTELESKGKLKKIKKGRGNIIILK